MMTVRNEIKAQIVRAGYTMQEVVDRLHEEYGWSDSVSNLSAKLQRESIRYKEVVELADVLGYDIYWGPRKGDAFVGRGGAAERVSFRTCAAGKAPLGGSPGTGPGEGAKSPDKAAHSGGRCTGKSVAGSTGGRA